MTDQVEEPIETVEDAPAVSSPDPLVPSDDPPLPEPEPDQNEVLVPYVRPFEPQVATMRIPTGVYDMDFLTQHFADMSHWSTWNDMDPAFAYIAFDAARVDDVLWALNNHDAAKLARRKEEALKQLGAIRWAKTQAFVHDGVLTHADPAIAVVNATLTMRQRRDIPAAYQQQWKLSDGAFRLWDEGQIEAFGFAIADHIQSCFDREAILTDHINLAQTDTELTGVILSLNEGWP